MFSWCMLGALICLCLPQDITGRLHLTFRGLYKFTPSLGRGVAPLAVVTPTTVSAGQADQDDEQLRRYQKLEAEKNQLENHLANVSAELAAEHEKVETLSAMRARFPGLGGAGFVNADTVAGFKANDNRIVINRGEADGIRKGQYVLSDFSVIGLVQETQSRTAVVKLITDKDSSMGVEIAGSKALRMMKGTGKGFARIGMVPNKKHVNKGDAVYTYKNPGLLDVPIIVGKVAECKPDDDNPLLWDITVRPVIKAEELSGVTVVVMNPASK
jgi:cell shape-determining protein MreC